MIEGGLKQKEKIMFIKRGVFEVIDKKERNISNPSTREVMRTDSIRTVRFRESKNTKNN